jgi:hypothetical protein
VGLWVPAAVNLAGLRSLGTFQILPAVLKFVPLILMAHRRPVLPRHRQPRHRQRPRRIADAATAYDGLFAVLLGIPVYIHLKRDRGEYGARAVSTPTEEPGPPEATPMPSSRAA